jgi:hypothetical protein
LKSLILSFKRAIYPYYEAVHYKGVMFRNYVKRSFHKPIDNTYLFILSPPFSGSTLLNELLSTSATVSSNNTLGTREGQQLPKVRKIMWEKEDQFDPAEKYDWNFIKAAWLKYWDRTKPILLEKSPPNLVRARQISDHFQPAYFICMVRDPYALCESQISRNSMAPSVAAELVVKWLFAQRQNIATLNNLLFFTYEELTINTLAVSKKLSAFLPALSDLDTARVFKAHNFKDTPMVMKNLNAEKIAKLTKEQFQEINRVLDRHRDLLDYFRYKRMG